jgi:hypothetical protein
LEHPHSALAVGCRDAGELSVDEGVERGCEASLADMALGTVVA